MSIAVSSAVKADLRRAYLVGLIGRRWEANAKGPTKFDCWHLTVHVERDLFQRNLPDIPVPEQPQWPWMIEQFKSHPEKQNWEEVKYVFGNLITAKDGSIVLMARSKNPAHCGVWLKKEELVIHCDQNVGVVCEDILTLRANGWAKLRFYEPKNG